MLILRTSVKSSILRYHLFRGTFLGAIGALLWFFSGIFIPVSILKIYGFLIVITGLLLIAIGLIPYQKLKRLEIEPNIIEISEDTLTYFSGKKPLYQIPLKKIKDAVYIEESQRYGIGLRFHESSNPYDLFLPYFSKRAQMQLTNEIKSV